MTLLWLDHKIFGNGYGMKSPYFDDAFIWLSGELYHWSGWFGAQLRSYQWRHPKPQERRKLAGHEFRPLDSSRRWGRVAVSWAAVGLSKDIDTANAELKALQRDLFNSQGSAA